MLVKTSPCGVLRLLSCMALGWAVQFANAGVHDADSKDARAERAQSRSRSESGTAARDVPQRNGAGNFKYSDGTMVRGSDHSGNAGKAHPDGSISYGDGTRVTHDSGSGDTKTVGPDGRVRLINRGTGTDKTTPGSAGSGDGKSREHGKLVANEKSPDAKKDGSGNGRSREDSDRGKDNVGNGKQELGKSGKFDAREGMSDAGAGSSKFERGGSSRSDSGSAAADVPQRNGAGNFEYSDGTMVRGSDRSGNAGKAHPDGSISYGDGTRVTHDSGSGDTKTVGPDGRVRLINQGTGTEKTVPAPTGSDDGKGTDPGKLTGSDKPSGSKYGGGRDDSDRSGKPGSSQNEKPNSGNSGKPDSGNSGKPDKGNSDKPEKNTSDKPEKNTSDKPDKGEKPSKGRVVQDDQTGGSGGSSGQVRPGESDRGGSQDDASSKGTPRTLNRGVGPGGRTGGETSTGNASRLTLPANAPVVNPADNPTGGARVPITPEGGKR